MSYDHQSLRKPFSQHYLTTVKVWSHLDQEKKFYVNLCNLGLTIGIPVFLRTAFDKNAVTFFLRMLWTPNFQVRSPTKYN